MESSGLCKDCHTADLEELGWSVPAEQVLKEMANRCRYCGKELEVSGKRGAFAKLYCTDACQRAAMRKRNTGPCVICGKMKLIIQKKICANCQRKITLGNPEGKERVYGEGGPSWSRIEQNMQRVVERAMAEGTVGRI